MGKKALTAAVLLAALFAVYFFGSGLIKCTSAYVEDFSVSEDGGTLTLRMGVASSAGDIGRARVHQQQGGKLYLDFYSAVGGVNVGSAPGVYRVGSTTGAVTQPFTFLVISNGIVFMIAV